MTDQFEKIQKEIDKVSTQIDKVNERIEYIEIILSTPFEQWSDENKLKYGTHQELRQKEKYLLEKEKDLRQKEKYLLEEKKHLQQKEKYLQQTLPISTPTNTEVISRQKRKNDNQPSEFAKRTKSYKGFMKAHKNFLRINRPFGVKAVDIQLFYDGFGEMKIQCYQFSKEQLTYEEINILEKLAEYMVGFYYCENTRQEKISGPLSKFLGFDLTLSRFKNTDASFSIRTSSERNISSIRNSASTENRSVKTISNEKTDVLMEIAQELGLLLIAEFKNEAGASGDAQRQLAAYAGKYMDYLLDQKESHQGRILAKTTMPLFLMDVVGPTLSVYGCVFTNDVNMERIFSIDFSSNFNMEQNFYLMKIFKIQLQKLHNWYNDIYKNINELPDIEKRDKNSIIPGLQLAKLEGFRSIYINSNNRSEIVKFPKKYCPELHQMLAEKKLAPALYSCEKKFGYYIIKMENLTGKYSPLSEELFAGHRETLLDPIKNALKVIHDAGYVHGDFRYQNIIVNSQTFGDIKLIDFDFSGRENDLTYPLRINDRIKWHKDVQPGCPLKKEHDLHFVELMERGESFIK